MEVHLVKTEVEVTPSDLRGMTPSFMSSTFESIFNSYINPKKYGSVVAEHLGTTHRTLQGSIYNFLLSALISFASFGTDPRNEVAVAGARKIKELVDKGEIDFQPFI